VLDLPEAISSAAPLLAAENMGYRVVHREGDALSELYFGLTSRSGTWAVHEIAQWQRDAGLLPATHPVSLSSGDVGLQLAFKTQQASAAVAAANSTTPATNNDG
jgi:hypothetical protein